MTSSSLRSRRRQALLVAAMLACGRGDDVANEGPASTGPTATGTASTESSTSSIGGDNDSSTAASSDAASSSADTEARQCVDVTGRPVAPRRIALVVDTSASMLEQVKLGGPPVDPWAETVTAVQAMIACLGDDPEARAQFVLRLMPGPVGSDACGHSDALDLDEWVDGNVVIDRLADVVPQGGRAMRRALEGLPADSDLVVVMSHGAPGCGDDIDPEVLDSEVASTIATEGAKVVFAGVALVPGPAPAKPDTEPDDIDAEQELYAIGTAIDTTKWCHYALPLFPATSACPNLVECMYGNRFDPCIVTLAPNGSADDIRMWIGGEAVPRLEACGTDPGWTYAGDGFAGWMLPLCTTDLCQRRYAEGIDIEYACTP